MKEKESDYNNIYIYIYMLSIKEDERKESGY